LAIEGDLIFTHLYRRHLNMPASAQRRLHPSNTGLLYLNRTYWSMRTRELVPQYFYLNTFLLLPSIF